MSFVKLQDGRGTYSLDSIRLRNQREASAAPQANTVELYMKDGILYQIDESGSERAVVPDLNNLDGNVTVNGDLIVTGKIDAPGTVVQVKTAMSGPIRQTITSTSPVAITGLSINFTPKYADSLILIDAQISTSATHVASFGIFKDGSATVSTSGETNTNEPNMQTTWYIGTSSPDYMQTIPVKHFEISSNTTARTYAVYATSGWAGVAYSLYINNRQNNDMAAFSVMTVTEIAQ